jgi:hypothetical protein
MLARKDCSVRRRRGLDRAACGDAAQYYARRLPATLPPGFVDYRNCDMFAIVMAAAGRVPARRETATQRTSANH